MPICALTLSADQPPFDECPPKGKPFALWDSSTIEAPPAPCPPLPSNRSCFPEELHTHSSAPTAPRRRRRRGGDRCPGGSAAPRAPLRAGKRMDPKRSAAPGRRGDPHHPRTSSRGNADRSAAVDSAFLRTAPPSARWWRDGGGPVRVWSAKRAANRAQRSTKSSARAICKLRAVCFASNSLLLPAPPPPAPWRAGRWPCGGRLSLAKDGVWLASGVGRVAGSLGLRGAKTWRPRRGRGSLKNRGFRPLALQGTTCGSLPSIPNPDSAPDALPTQVSLLPPPPPSNHHHPPPAEGTPLASPQFPDSPSTMQDVRGWKTGSYSLPRPSAPPSSRSAPEGSYSRQPRPLTGNYSRQPRPLTGSYSRQPRPLTGSYSRQPRARSAPEGTHRSRPHPAPGTRADPLRGAVPALPPPPARPAQ